ncbi:hypothetical protein [Mucilaginibacter pedocola]|uniref:Uncharacterized protein n=1 Tax=Mucilaginibacter pedocola TaxID=1792845 RepID=A0A1S9P6A3_9SPHI|nr:hypothetical protein [Mucilaginibacter pedocola]OOQ56482.1 hypothetical protein BC343_18735 [Mucilaginibacter pedocola]
MHKLYLPILFVFFGVTAFAQTPDSLLKPSPVKTISNAEYDALLKGRDQYHMSLVADLNGYPSAQKALKYKKELDLSPTQTAALTKINTELQRKKVEMGGFIVKNEAKLDELFQSKKLTEGDILFFGNRSGLYYGELRNAILMAAYNTYKQLAPSQISKLKAFKNE